MGASFQVTDRILADPTWNGQEKRFCLSPQQLRRLETKWMPADKDIPSRSPIFGAAIACALCIFLPLFFILFAGVNVPFADEWWYTALVRSFKSGGATFATFWSPNNEHRMFIPRLEFALLAVLTSWNSKLIMLAGWIVMVVAAAFLFFQFKKIYSKSHPILWAISTGTAVAALLTLVQRENWLWAFQFAFFFIQFSALVAIFTVCRSDIALPLRLTAAIGLGVAASYSSAQGLLVWPALIFSLCLTEDTPRIKLVGAVSLIIAACLTVWFYFHGLARPSSLQLRPEQLTGKPQLPFVAFLGLAGNSLAGWISYEHRPHRAWPIGLAITIIIGGFVAILIRQRKISRAAPWLGLAAFSYLFCTAISYGRLGLGYTGGFLASRYTSHVTFLVVTLLALLVLVTDTTSPRPPHFARNRLKVASAFCLVALTGALILVGDIREFISGLKDRDNRLFARELIPFYTYFDPKVDGVMSGPFFPLCPLRSLGIFDIGLKPLLEDGHFRRLPPATFVAEPADVSGKYTVSARLEEHRYLEIVRRGWQLRGIVTGGDREEPDLVFLKPHGAPGFIGAAKLHRPSADQDSGKTWQLFLSPLLLPDRTIPLEMWIFNRRANQFVKVNQAAS